MTIKKVAFGIIGAVIISVLTAIITIYGTQMLARNGVDITKSDGLFSSKKESKPQKFIEVKNVVVTLQTAAHQQHYLQMDLAFATSDEEGQKEVNELSPVLRGTTVTLLSAMDYDALREMPMDTLRQKLLAAYTARFIKLQTEKPFTDVIISKMVYQ
ncbi:flagellar basal body-associated protein FliL [Scandinavium sp. NPDC088450]|uniref:flagellar basal body-associated FliL family protein n=1 Tax=Scandinavium sp. NPDC088450 TaxID=3364514 RepID=UPI00384A87E1